MSFVGTKTLTSKDELIQLLETLSVEQSYYPSYYFLRWVHCVSGIWKRRSNEFKCLEKDLSKYITDKNIDATFPSPEGQLFNSQLELRWKQKGSAYEVLLLNKDTPLSKDLSFQQVEGKWKTQDHRAYFHERAETRFPKKFNYPEHLKIAQRYFMNQETKTVHFVALTVENKK